MNESFEILLERFLPYVAASKTIDLVSSKFGILVVENVGRRKPELEVDAILGFEELAEFIFAELESDVAEKHAWRYMTAEDAEELRRLAAPYINDLPDALYAQELLDRFIAQNLK